MKVLEPYTVWIKIALVLALCTALMWLSFEAGSSVNAKALAKAEKELAEFKFSAATGTVEQQGKEIEIQYVTKVEYVDRVQYVTQWKTKKEKELVYVSQPLAQCRISDDAVRLYNEARDCALQADPTGCRVDVEMRSSATPATGQ